MEHDLVVVISTERLASSLQDQVRGHGVLYSAIMAKKPKTYTWRITEIREKDLGSVEAASAEEAIKVAVEEYGLSPERAKRLVAQREV